MSQIDELRDQIHRAWAGGPWHGPGLRELLDGVDAKQAAARPVAEAHTIAELVLHLTAWTALIHARMAGREAAPIGPDQDWPAAEKLTGARWKAMVKRLGDEHEGIVAALAELVDGDLKKKAPGSQATRLELLHGVLQHDAYHAGQVGLLRKALGVGETKDKK